MPVKKFETYVPSLAQALVSATREHGQPNHFEASFIASGDAGGPSVEIQHAIATNNRLTGLLIDELVKRGWRGTKPVYDPDSREWLV